VQRVRAAYLALARRDTDALLDLMDPAVEFHNPDYAMETGVRRGHDGVRAALQSGWEVMEEIRFDVERIVDGGDVIVVVGRSRAVGRTGGVPVEAPFGHVLEIRGDKAIRIAWFQDHAEAFAAAGLSDR